MTNSPYSSYTKFKKWEQASFGSLLNTEEIYFTSEIQKCGFKSIAGKSTIEIGYGNGNFVSWAKQQGANWIGVELLPELVELAKQNGFRAFATVDKVLEEVDHGSIDLIVGFDIFEHLTYQEFTELIAKCRALLKPSGKIMGRVPSGDSPFGLRIQNGDITHKSVFGSGIIRQIALDTGYKVEIIRPPAFPLWGDGLKTFIRRFFVRCGRAIAYPLIKNIFMGGGNPILTPNLIFVLAIERSLG